MSAALERLARNVAARKGKNKNPIPSRLSGRTKPESGSGKSSSSPAVGQSSPQPVTSKGSKRQRADGDIMDLTFESEKGKFKVLPCILNKEFFGGASLKVHHGESLALEGMDQPSKRALLAQDTSALMRILEMAVVYTEEGTSQERERVEDTEGISCYP